MKFDEAHFRARITARAAELGMPLTRLLAAAGVNHDTFYKEPASRRLDTFQKLAKACRWSLAEVLGLSLIGRIDIELSIKAMTIAQRVMGRLPRAAQTDRRLMELHGYVYDALADRVRDGRPIDDEILTAYEEILLQVWHEKPAPPAPE